MTTEDFQARDETLRRLKGWKSRDDVRRAKMVATGFCPDCKWQLIGCKCAAKEKEGE